MTKTTSTTAPPAVETEETTAAADPPVGSKESMARAYLHTTLAGRLLQLGLMYFVARQPTFAVKTVDELASIVDEKAMAIIQNTFSAENLQSLLAMRSELSWIRRCDENMYLLLREEASAVAARVDVVKS